MSRFIRRRAERGSSLVEVMIATAILTIASLGLMQSAIVATTSNALAHRRTSLTLLRGATVDRLAVTPRTTLAALAADTWYVDACWGADAQPTGTNGAYATSYACPAGSAYRTWLQVTPAASGAAWKVSTYAERIDPGCSAAARASSSACSATDLILTD
jgi:Tfp pilus assembly protein PilV